MTEKSWKAGDILKNGATLLAKKAYGNGWIVICSWKKGKELEFVTWEMGPQGDTYTGHYFQTLTGAMVDYKKRGYQYGL